MENYGIIGNVDAKIELEKCCEKPFPTYSVSTGYSKCISCEKEYKEVTEFIYSCEDCKLKDIVIDNEFVKFQDKTKCKSCSKEVSFSKRKKVTYKKILTKRTFHKTQ